MSSDLALEHDAMIDTLYDPIKLGISLRAARKAAGVTQEVAAEHLGVARTTIVAIEQGARHVRANELCRLAVLYQCHLSQFFEMPEPPTEPVLSARKRVLKRVWRCEPDETMHATLLALALPPKELERMAATVLHMLIEQEGEQPSMPEQPTPSMLAEMQRLDSEIQYLRDENLRLARRSLALIAYSEDCFEAMSDVLKHIEAMKALHARGTELLPLLVPQKETTREGPSNG